MVITIDVIEPGDLIFNAKVSTEETKDFLDSISTTKLVHGLVKFLGLACFPTSGWTIC